jgi:alkylation response protein AidB-like acyl-CoA dehydrogenase
LSLSEVLRSIGWGSLPLGRLFEGHVNALELVLRYGNERRVQLVAEEAQAGKLFGVWNTDDANGLRLIHRHGRSWLEGRKVLASGPGYIERPLVTATDENGRRLIDRGQDPHQAARLGRAAMAVETGRLWVAQAASTTEGPLGSRAPEQLVAYVNLARLAVEAAALELMQLVQRSVGLQAFMRPNPIERISRDLATYLRQPGPDRALTDAAAWTLAQPVSMQDLWR